MKVYLVYKYTDIMFWDVGKVFGKEEDAVKYCEDQNALHKPEFDDWGYCGGVYHTYDVLEVE